MRVNTRTIIPRKVHSQTQLASALSSLSNQFHGAVEMKIKSIWRQFSCAEFFLGTDLWGVRHKREVFWQYTQPNNNDISVLLDISLKHFTHLSGHWLVLFILRSYDWFTASKHETALHLIKPRKRSMHLWYKALKLFTVLIQNKSTWTTYHLIPTPHQSFVPVFDLIYFVFDMFNDNNVDDDGDVVDDINNDISIAPFTNLTCKQPV